MGTVVLGDTETSSTRTSEFSKMTFGRWLASRHNRQETLTYPVRRHGNNLANGTMQLDFEFQSKPKGVTGVIRPG